MTEAQLLPFAEQCSTAHLGGHDCFFFTSLFLQSTLSTVYMRVDEYVSNDMDERISSFTCKFSATTPAEQKRFREFAEKTMVLYFPTNLPRPSRPANHTKFPTGRKHTGRLLPHFAVQNCLSLLYTQDVSPCLSPKTTLSAVITSFYNTRVVKNY